MRKKRIIFAVLLAGGAAFQLLRGGLPPEALRMARERVEEWKHRLVPDAASGMYASFDAAGLKATDAPPKPEEPDGWLVPAKALPAFKAVDRDMDRLTRGKAEGSIDPAAFAEGLRDLVRRYREGFWRWGYESRELYRDLSRMEAAGSIVDPDVRQEVRQRLEDGARWKQRVSEKLEKRGARL
jgi:hypothetical protein